MFHQSLDEEKKLKIAELYQTTELSMDEIADTVEVSLKTAYNYRNYGTEAEIKPNLDESPTVETSTTSSKKNQWECRKCGFITDRRLKYCHNCGSGPFDSVFTKVGSPEHIPYIAPQSEPETTEPEDEYCDTTRDYWVCQECDHISNTEFDQCPECDSDKIIFAPNGKEPRSPLNQLVTKKDNEETEEENEEFEYECGGCGHEFNETLEKCPNCGMKIDYGREFRYVCSECGYMFNDDPESCPICGENFD